MSRHTTTDPDASPATTVHDLAIEVPETSPVDRPVAVRVHARPGEAVDLQATMTASDGTEWTSRMYFEADDQGLVDLTSHRSTGGSYTGVHPMGWCWSMTCADDDALLYRLMDGQDLAVRFRAAAGDRRAQTTVTRTVAGDDVARRDVAESGVVGTHYHPDDDRDHPPVLVLHGSGGHRTHFTAALLASHGFSALALQYSGEADPLPDGVGRVPLAYFDDAADWLRDQDGVRDGQVGAVGRSWGALASLLLGARRDWVGAVVSYAGSGVVWDTPSGDPAWLDADGDPVPALSGQGKPTLCEGQLDDADGDARRAATIAVEDTDAPILLVSGARDPIWPARRLSAIAADRLRRHDVDHPVLHVSGDDAGHFCTPPFLPKADDRFAGTADGIAGTDADAWPTALEYLRRGLGPEVGE
jgi:dienelactone hydrolase